MRLAPDESLAAFRRQLEAWLDDHAPRPEEVEEGRRSSAHLPGWARRWQRTLFDAGWLVPGWPPELGGRNSSAQEQMAYFEVMAERQIPRALNPQGLSICAASIVEFGNDEQRERFAVPTLKGEITWCVGMSEPGAGSDLASLRTRAERRADAGGADHFVVNGQKVWTSGAHEADYCMCYVRTDPGAPKHRGISVVIIDMRAEGITCRPLPELTDRRHVDFNEVFFTDVVVPAENLVGEENKGWALAQGSLRHERAMLWVMNVATFDRAVEGLVRLSARPADGSSLPADEAARPTGPGPDPGTHPEPGTPLATIGDGAIFADTVADLAMDAQAMRCLGYLGFAKATRGEPPTEHLLLKLFTSESERRACLVGLDALGAQGLDLDGPGPNRWTGFDLDHFGAPAIDASLTAPFSDGPWAVQYLRSFAGTIAGGTSEIQRNIIAERVLGLPRS